MANQNAGDGKQSATIPEELGKAKW